MEDFFKKPIIVSVDDMDKFERIEIKKKSIEKTW